MPNEAEREKAEGFFNKLLTHGFDVMAKIFNAESLSVERLGAGFDELEGAYVETKRESSEAISKAFGIPTALMMRDTAFASEVKILYRLWYEAGRFQSIYHTIEGTLNSQLMKERGFTFRFDLQSLDIFQEDESKRSSSLLSFVTAFEKSPEVAQLGMDILGYDLTPDQAKILEKLVKETEAEKEQQRDLIQQGIDNPKEKAEPKRAAEDPKRQNPDEGKSVSKSSLTIDEIKDLELWYSRAKAWHVKGKGNAVDWECKHLPESIAAPIREKLAVAKTELDIVKAFEMGETKTEEPAYYSGDIGRLADAINNAANQTPAPHYDFTMPEINVNVPETKSDVTVNVPEGPAPVVNVKVPKQEKPVVNIKSDKPDESEAVVKAVRKLSDK